MTEKEFHSIRTMVYLNHDILITPDKEFKNSSHKEWFSNINVDINTTIRGYYYNNILILYIKDFEVPDISMKTIELLSNKYNFNYIGLGCIKGEIGEMWKPKYLINKHIK